jgi:hypothetical protein
MHNTKTIKKSINYTEVYIPNATQKRGVFNLKYSKMHSLTYGAMKHVARVALKLGTVHRSW